MQISIEEEVKSREMQISIEEEVKSREIQISIEGERGNVNKYKRKFNFCFQLFQSLFKYKLHATSL